MRIVHPAALIAAALLASPSVWAQGLKHVPDEVPPGVTGAADAPSPKSAALSPSRGVDEKTAEEVRAALVRLINTALTEGRFEDLGPLLSRADRLRANDDAKKSAPHADFDKALSAFRHDFQEKFSRDFELKPDHLKNATVTRAADPNTVMVSLSDLEKNPSVTPGAAGTSGLSGEVPPKPTGGIVTKDVAGETGLSVVAGPSVTLVKEGRPASVVDGKASAALWKLNIPNEITGKQLQSNLARHIRKLADQKSTWTDADATARAAASAVLQAMVDSTIASE